MTQKLNLEAVSLTTRPRMKVRSKVTAGGTGDDIVNTIGKAWCSFTGWAAGDYLPPSGSGCCVRG